MHFCTSIHCMDGRIQLPIHHYLNRRHAVQYVDTITRPGPCKLLAENKDKAAVASILQCIEISINKHQSQLIAVSGHHDCAGNPCGEREQKKQIKTSVAYLQSKYPHVKVIGLWIDSKWNVHTV